MKVSNVPKNKKRNFKNKKADKHVIVFIMYSSAIAKKLHTTTSSHLMDDTDTLHDLWQSISLEPIGFGTEGGTFEQTTVCNKNRSEMSDHFAKHGEVYMSSDPVAVLHPMEKKELAKQLRRKKNQISAAQSRRKRQQEVIDMKTMIKNQDIELKKRNEDISHLNERISVLEDENEQLRNNLSKKLIEWQSA